MDQGDWHEQVAKYLLVQHITLHATTGWSLSELLMGLCLHLIGCIWTLQSLSPRAVLTHHDLVCLGTECLRETMRGKFLEFQQWPWASYQVALKDG